MMKSWLSSLFPSSPVTQPTTTFSQTGYTTNYCSNSKPSKPVQINVDHPKMCSNLYDTYFTSTASDPYSSRTTAGTCVISFRCFAGLGNISSLRQAKNGLDYNYKLSPLVQQAMQRNPNPNCCETKCFHKRTNCHKQEYEVLDGLPHTRLNMSQSAPGGLCSLGLYKSTFCGLVKQLSLIESKMPAPATNAAAAETSSAENKEMNNCDVVESLTKTVIPKTDNTLNKASNGLKPCIPCKNPYISYILGYDNSDAEEDEDDSWDDSDEEENGTWRGDDCKNDNSMSNHIWEKLETGLAYPFFTKSGPEELCAVKFDDSASDPDECGIDDRCLESGFPTGTSSSDCWNEGEDFPYLSPSEGGQDSVSKPRCFNPLINYILGWTDSDVESAEVLPDVNVLEIKDDTPLQTKENENLWNGFVKSEDNYSLFYGSGLQSSVKEKESLKTKKSSNRHKNGVCKRVRFDDKPVVHVMVVWSFAYRQSRRGEWECYARDRERFRCRIKEVGRAVDWCLQPCHRDSIRDNVIIAN